MTMFADNVSETKTQCKNVHTDTTLCFFFIFLLIPFKTLIIILFVLVAYDNLIAKIKSLSKYCTDLQQTLIN